jgi:hypothetical protein
MSSINQDEFQAMCEEVRRQAPELLKGVTDPSRRTEVLLNALLQHVCQHLHLEIQSQMSDLNDRDGFALLQTLEEHMKPEFFYSNIIDQCLLGVV